jgi:hypothetical protein
MDVNAWVRAFVSCPGSRSYRAATATRKGGGVHATLHEDGRVSLDVTTCSGRWFWSAAYGWTRRGPAGELLETSEDAPQDAVLTMRSALAAADSEAARFLHVTVPA